MITNHRNLSILIIFFVLLVGMLLYLTSASASESGIDGNVFWELRDNGILVLSGTGTMNNYDYYDSEYDEYHIEYTPSPWSKSSNKIQCVIIQEGITSIGDYAFEYCSCISDVIIPNSVTRIGKGAFYYCSSLKNISLPNSIINIKDEAFYHCSSLIEIDIPENVTTIGRYAFSHCINLTGITISNKVKVISISMFRRCESLTEIILPDNLERIEEYAFCECRNLKKLDIPSSVVSFGKYAFESCSSLISLTIPDSATNIDRLFDFSNPILYSTIGSDGAKALSKSRHVFKDKRYPKLMFRYTFTDDEMPYLGIADADKDIVTAVIPNAVTTIEQDAFCNCRNLTDIIIPDSVTTIGNNAFNGCISLKNITIPNSVTAIGGNTFRFCGLTSIIIPDSVSRILWATFADCKYLTSVIIPNSIVYIEDDAFLNCTKLTDVIFVGTEEQWNSIEISYGNDYLMEANLQYRSYGALNISIPESVTSIESEAFAGIKDGLAIYIPETVISIADDAFFGVDNITIVGSKGSAAEFFAIEKGFIFLEK